MLCINAPRKAMARIHILVSLILIIACTALAFTPLMKIVVSKETSDSIQNLVEFVLSQNSGSESSEEINAHIKKVIDSMDLENASVELSLLSTGKTSTSLSKISDPLNKLISAKGDDADAQREEAVKALKDIFVTEDYELNPELRDFVIVLAAVAGPMIPEDPSHMSEDQLPEMIKAGIPSMIGLVFALILMVVIPIIFAVLALVSLIVGLTKLGDPTIGEAKLAKRLPKMVVHPMTVMLVTCLTSTVVYTTSTLLILILAGVGTLLNVVFTRLHSWDKKQIATVNAVQAVSLFSIGAYIFFYLQMLKMGVFKSFLGKAIAFFTAKSPSVTTAVYTDFTYIGLAIFFAFFSMKYLARVLRRVSLACTPKRKGNARACHLVRAIFLLAVTVLPMMALGSTANNGGAFISATVAQETALLYGFIATCVMILTEIVLLILRKVFKRGMTPAEVADVLTGVGDATTVEGYTENAANGETASDDANAATEPVATESANEETTAEAAEGSDKAEE